MIDISLQKSLQDIRTRILSGEEPSVPEMKTFLFAYREGRMNAAKDAAKERAASKRETAKADKANSSPKINFGNLFSKDV